MHVFNFRKKFSTDPHPPDADKSPIMLDELKDEKELDDLLPTETMKHAHSGITIEEKDKISHEELKLDNVTICFI